MGLFASSVTKIQEVANLKNHVWRPLLIVLAIVGGILAMRMFLVPSDFGIQERGYMYGWHRKNGKSIR